MPTDNTLVEIGEPVETLTRRTGRVPAAVFEQIAAAADAHPGKFVPFTLPGVKSMQHYVGQINKGNVPELLPVNGYSALTRKGQAYITYDPDAWEVHYKPATVDETVAKPKAKAAKSK